MFRFHETTRTRVARTAFVVLCAAPTLATLAWIIWRHRPGHVRDEAIRLSGVLHVDARLTDWREPRPGMARSSGMTLVEPGLDVTLVAFESAEVQSSGNMRRIAAAAVTLDAGHFDALLHRARGWPGKMDVDAVRIDVERLSIIGEDGKASIELRGVQLRVDRQATGAIKAQLTAHPWSDAANAPELRMVLEQVPGEEGGLIRATIDARQVGVPSWLVATMAPMFAACGEGSTFAGMLQFEAIGGHVQGAAQGQVDAIVLAALLPAASPHVAEGQAALTIADLHWRDQQIESLSGSVRATNLTLSKSLINAAVGSLFCGQGHAGAVPETIFVEQLACRFQLNRKGLTITGELGGESNVPQGCLIASAGRPILVQPPYVDIPPGAWVQFLAGPASSWVPATQGAVEMAGRLPLPK